MAAIPPGGGDVPGLAAIAAAAVPMNVLENQEPSVTMKAQVSICVATALHFILCARQRTESGLRACAEIN